MESDIQAGDGKTPARESLEIDIQAGDGKTANLFLQCIVILKDENEDLTSGQEQRLRRMEREYERRQQVVFSLIRGGGKTVHVVFKYLSRSLPDKGVGAGRYSAPPPKKKHPITEFFNV